MQQTPAQQRPTQAPQCYQHHQQPQENWKHPVGRANHRKGVDVCLIIIPVLFQLFAECGGGMKVERLAGGW